MHLENKSCEAVRRLLDAYVSSELLVETNVEILEHLDRCSSCSTAFDSRVRARAALKRAVAQEVVPPELVASIRNALRRRNLTYPRRAAAAVLLALAVSAAAFWYLPRVIESRNGSTERILAMGLQATEHCPVESGLSYLGWEYNGLAEVLGEEMPSDYGITGARRCMLKGRLFIHVSLESEHSRISFVVTEKGEDHLPARAGQESVNAGGVPVYSTTIRNHQVAGFETRAHFAFLVSSTLDRKDSLQLASAIATLHAPLVRSTLKEGPQ
jgi:hypothetical protein